MAILYSDAENYEKVVSDGVSLLVFYADWCGPCKMLHPVLEELDKDGHKIVKINSDENPQVMQMFGLRGVPSMILYKDGEPMEKTSGYRPKAQLEGWLKKF
ncbi:thioredoxin family protein [Mycoplasmatota bacterium WC44]